jgi:hypothetical protein
MPVKAERIPTAKKPIGEAPPSLSAFPPTTTSVDLVSTSLSSSLDSTEAEGVGEDVPLGVVVGVVIDDGVVVGVVVVGVEVDGLDVVGDSLEGVNDLTRFKVYSCSPPPSLGPMSSKYSKYVRQVYGFKSAN